MKPFDGRKGKKLSKEIVSDMRFFGYYIGNGTLLLSNKEGVNMNVVYETSETLGNIYGIKLFRSYDKMGNYNALEAPVKKSISIKRYIQFLNEPTIPTAFDFPFTEQQLAEEMNWRSVIARFFRDFGLQKLETMPLLNLEEDYGEEIVDYGNSMEMLTAIFCNVLRMDEQFNVLNEPWARHRASQYIRFFIDDEYKIIPKLKEWETTLWL